MENKMTQEDRVLKYMKDFGGITSLEAFAELGITRLSAKIFNLRREYQIEDETVLSTNRYGDKVHYKRYFLKEK